MRAPVRRCTRHAVAAPVRLSRVPTPSVTAAPSFRGRVRRAAAATPDAVRWREWYASKVPFVWSAAAWATLASPLSDGEVLRRTAGAIVFTCCCGVFGHLANDVADRDCDRAAGRRTAAARLAPATAAVVLVMCAVAAIAALAVGDAPRPALGGGVLALGLAAAYSLRPVRLKAHGAVGLWGGAAAQRTLPMFVALAALGRIDAGGWALLLVAQLVGLRWMLVHQLGDVAADRDAHVRTWAVTAGEDRARVALRRLVLPMELTLLAVALSLQGIRHPMLWWLPAFALAIAAVWAWLCHGSEPPYSLIGYDRQPLAAFYQLTYPLGLWIAVAHVRPGLWLVAVALLAWQHRYLGHRVRCAARRARERLRPPAIARA